LSKPKVCINSINPVVIVSNAGSLAADKHGSNMQSFQAAGFSHGRAYLDFPELLPAALDRIHKADALLAAFTQ
jgi:hypothetical protein